MSEGRQLPAWPTQVALVGGGQDGHDRVTVGLRVAEFKWDSSSNGARTPHTASCREHVSTLT